MHPSSLWVLKGMRKTESSLLQIHETLSEAHRRCCPKMVHHSWVTPECLSPSNRQIWPQGNTSISLQLQYKNKSSLSSAHCRHTALMHCTQKGESGHKEHKGGTERSREVAPLAGNSSVRNSLADKVHTGSKNREIPGRDDLWWFYACSLGYRDTTLSKKHLCSDHRDLSIHRKRLSVPAIPASQELPPSSNT